LVLLLLIDIVMVWSLLLSYLFMSSIILRYSKEHSSLRLSASVFSFSAVINLFLSMSNMDKVSFKFSITSSKSTPLVFSLMYSCKLMHPSLLPSPSTSCFVVTFPRLFIINPSSDVDIFLYPFTLNFFNTCSSSPHSHTQLYRQ
ncbi:hypothetical protein VIGAN_08194500, partial [Vigna angularis var. angularis]